MMEIDNPGGTPTKDIFEPVTYSTSWDNLRGAKIVAALDFVVLLMRIPHDFVAIKNLELIFSPISTGASMNFLMRTYYGLVGEAFNVHTEVQNPRNIGATVAGQNLAHDISDLVNVAPLVAEHLLVIQVQHNATVLAANTHLLGVRLRYS